MLGGIRQSESRANVSSACAQVQVRPVRRALPDLGCWSTCKFPAVSYAVRTFVLVPKWTIIAVSRPCRLLVTSSTQQEPNKDKAVSQSTDHRASSENPLNSLPDSSEAPRRQKRKAGSSDWIASAVTRRFGYGTPGTVIGQHLFLVLVLPCLQVALEHISLHSIGWQEV